MKEDELLVIGTILDPTTSDGYALAYALREAKPSDFEDERCQTVFRAMRELHGDGLSATVPALTRYFIEHPDRAENFEAVDIGLFLNECQEKYSDIARNIGNYVQKVVEASVNRQAAKTLSDAQAKAEAGSLQEVVDELVKGQNRLAQIGKPLPSMEEDLEAGLHEQIMDKPVPPIPTFSETLNRNLNGGLHGNKFMVLTAPAAGGKTTLLLQMAEEIAQAGTPCLFVALEMSKKELLVKSLARIGEFNAGAIEEQRYLLEPDLPESQETQRQVGGAIERYASEYARNMYIWESEADLTPDQIRAEITKIQHHRMQRDSLEELPRVVVCIDPLHELSTGKSDLDSDPISKAGRIAGDLKRMARALNSPVVGLSDTTKSATERMETGEKGGQTAFRYSYDIAHRADITGEIRTGKNLADVALGKKKKDEEADKARLRKHYLGIETDNPLGGGRFKDTEAVYALLDLSKQRTGTTKTTCFVYEKSFQKFTEIRPAKKKPLPF